jgi:hypothetical protein
MQAYVATDGAGNREAGSPNVKQRKILMTNNFGTKHCEVKRA